VRVALDRLVADVPVIWYLLYLCQLALRRRATVIERNRG
jgi:hypothetical protein